MTEFTEIERRLISACMAGGPADVAKAVSLGVTSCAFSDCQIGQIWAGLLAAATNDRKTDSFHVLRRVYGPTITAKHAEELKSITQLEPTSVYVRQLAEVVVGEARRREVLPRLKLAAEAVASRATWDDAWSSASDAIREAQRKATENGKTSDLATFVDAYIAEEKSGKPRGTIGTGVGPFDERLGLIAPGEVLVIAGRPGVGKTALALQIADAALVSGKIALVISLEMSGKDLVGRIAKQRAGRRAAIFKGCSKAEYDAAKAARIASAESLKQLQGKLHIFEVTEANTVSKIEERLAMLAAADLLPGVVVVDYLQLLQPEDSRAPREQQVATMSRRLKLMALSFNVPVLLLSQLNRDAEKNDRAPKLSDLRESGSIEQDADRVWLISPNREQPVLVDSPSVPIIIDQAKNRNGPSDVLQAATFFKPAFIFEKQ